MMHHHPRSLLLLVLAAAGLVLAALPARADDARSGLLRRYRVGLPPANSRNHASVKAAFRDVVRAASQSTVRVQCKGSQAALGAIVHRDGYAITKASELEGELSCLLADGRRVPARIVGVHPEHDLALLKLDATDLKPVPWSDAESPAVGAWLATTGLTQQPRAIGVVSARPRQIAEPRAVLGVRLEASPDGPRIYLVVPDSGASRAHLKRGDVVLEVDGEKVTTPDELSAAIRRRQPGDRVRLSVRRGEETRQLTATLGDVSNLGNNTQAEIMESLGGPLSKRRAGFPAVLQHDTVLQPRDCGGPVVDIEGQVVGINIARASRVASYAIPAGVLKSVLPDLLAGKYAVGAPPAARESSTGGR